MVWISDGARGFWGLFERCFAHCATGILDFYHAASHLWTAAMAYQDGNPTRTPRMWFERLRHQLRHGFAHRIIKELDWLSKRPSTAADTQPVLAQVRDYLSDHLEHLRYHQFKKLGLREQVCVGVRTDLTTCCCCDWPGSINALMTYFLTTLWRSLRCPPTARYAAVEKPFFWNHFSSKLARFDSSSTINTLLISA